MVITHILCNVDLDCPNPLAMIIKAICQNFEHRYAKGTTHTESKTLELVH